MSRLDSVDHLVLAVPDLTAGMEELEQLTGVRPAIGGRHPNWGTCNALISLGPATYLEVIAPDPEATVAAECRPGIFSSGAESRMIGWFAKCSNLTAAREAAGDQLGEIQQGARTLPDGRELRWQLTDPTVMVMDGIFPMLIDWGESPHPAASAPGGCCLLNLQLAHPDPGPVRSLLRAVDVEMQVDEGPDPVISALIESPQGQIRLPL